MRVPPLVAALAFATALAAASEARATILLSENFEASDGLNGTVGDGLGQWAPDGSANIVTDALSAGNHVLNFNATAQAGDIFSTGINVNPTATYYLSFDYRGTAVRSGGFVGYSNINSSVGNNGRFFAGADPTYVDPNVTPLTSDGLWHHYEIAFNQSTWIPAAASTSYTTIYIMIEDFMGPGGNNQVANDAFFDNIVLSTTPLSPAVPEPGTLTVLGLGAASLAVRRRFSR